MVHLAYMLFMIYWGGDTELSDKPFDGNIIRSKVDVKEVLLKFLDSLPQRGSWSLRDFSRWLRIQGQRGDVIGWIESNYGEMSELHLRDVLGTDKSRLRRNRFLGDTKIKSRKIAKDHLADFVRSLPQGFQWTGPQDLTRWCERIKGETLARFIATHDPVRCQDGAIDWIRTINSMLPADLQLHNGVKVAALDIAA